jgi:hypothetical protein
MLKRVITLFFVFVFLIQSTSSLWIVISFYIQRDYISKNICVNRFDAIPVCKGQCILSKELDKNEKQERNAPELKQKEIQLFSQQNFILNFIDEGEINENKITSYSSSTFSSVYLSSVFRPPIFI